MSDDTHFMDARWEGLCASCGDPFFRGNQISMEILYAEGPGGSREEIMRHKNCESAASWSGGYDISTLGKAFKLWTAKNIGAEYRYFLSMTIPGHRPNFYSAENIEPVNISQTGDHQRRAVEMVRAVIEQKIRDPKKGEAIQWARDTSHKCEDCDIIIVRGELFYSMPATAATRHGMKCQPEHWNTMKPQRGGGVLYYPKKTWAAPLGFKDLGWTAILYKTRTTYGRTRHFFKRMTDAQFMDALGRETVSANLNWMSDTCGDGLASQDDGTKCPRCGGDSHSHFNAGHDGRMCYTCKYQFVVSEK